jgi:phosphoserine phosphatase
MRNRNGFKLVIFDLDGTLTEEKSIWQYIHRRLGKWYGFVEKYNEKFMSGELSYKELCEFEAQTWKGRRVDELLEIVKTVPFHAGVDELIAYVKNRGLKLALVSSGLSVLSNWVHERYGFDYSISNDLLHENGILTGKVKIQVYNDQKAKWVKRILKQFGVKPEESIAIGDSVGDLEMFRLAGFSIAFNSSCKPLDQIATLCIQSQNLADIIPQLPL